MDWEAIRTIYFIPLPKSSSIIPIPQTWLGLQNYCTLTWKCQCVKWYLNLCPIRCQGWIIHEVAFTSICVYNFTPQVVPGTWLFYTRRYWSRHTSKQTRYVLRGKYQWNGVSYGLNKHQKTCSHIDVIKRLEIVSLCHSVLPVVYSTCSARCFTYCYICKTYTITHSTHDPLWKVELFLNQCVKVACVITRESCTPLWK